MASNRGGLSAVLVLLLAPVAQAQQAGTPPAPPVETAANPAGLDVNRLPLNLSRINRGLRRSVEREERNGLNLRYTIDVYGSLPRVQFFDPKRESLLTGQVPHSAPSHQDMIQFWTPQEFSSPAMNLNNVGRWLTDKSK